MFFQMFQPRVNDLFHSKHLGAKGFFYVIDMTISVREPNVDGAGKIVQPLIIDEDADKHGKCREGRSGESRHQLIRSDH